MSDQVALWSEEVQTTIKSFHPCLVATVLCSGVGYNSADLGFIKEAVHQYFFNVEPVLLRNVMGLL